MSYENTCGSDYRQISRELEEDLLEIEGVARVYRGSNGRGELRVELTVDDVDEYFAQVTPPGVRFARFASSLLVPNVYASCAQPSASSLVTYSVMWTPEGGAVETLHEGVKSPSQYIKASSFGDPSDDETRLTVGGSLAGLSFVSADGRTDTLELHSFRDPDHPEAEIDL